MVGKRFCDTLFSLERDFAELTAEERRQKCWKLSRPVFDRFFEWLGALKPPLKAGLVAEVVYTQNQRAYSKQYLEDGRLEISNNRAERSIKPFVIGRKTLLFANTPRSVKASAILFNAIETTKENRVNPNDYLTHIFNNSANRYIRNNLDYFEFLLP